MPATGSCQLDWVPRCSWVTSAPKKNYLFTTLSQLRNQSFDSSYVDQSDYELAKADPSLSLTEMAAVVYCSVSKWTVRRRLLEAGFQSRRRPYEVELTKRNKDVRMNGAKSHCHWRPQWTQVVWTNEVTVIIRG